MNMPPRRRMPKLVRFVLINSSIGIVIGWLVAAALFWFDVNGLGTMLAHSQHKAPMIALVAVMFGTTFGFGSMATALIMLPSDKDEFDKL